MEKISNTDLDTDLKLLEWSEKKFQNKVNEKISSDIVLTKVALGTMIDSMKKVLEKHFLLVHKIGTLHTRDKESHPKLGESNAVI